jgi:hypothetical protein
MLQLRVDGSVKSYVNKPGDFSVIYSDGSNGNLEKKLFMGNTLLTVLVFCILSSVSLPTTINALKC